MVSPRRRLPAARLHPFGPTRLRPRELSPARGMAGPEACFGAWSEPVRLEPNCARTPCSPSPRPLPSSPRPSSDGRRRSSVGRHRTAGVRRQAFDVDRPTTAARHPPDHRPLRRRSTTTTPPRDTPMRTTRHTQHNGSIRIATPTAPGATRQGPHQPTRPTEGPRSSPPSPHPRRRQRHPPPDARAEFQSPVDVLGSRAVVACEVG